MVQENYKMTCWKVSGDNLIPLELDFKEGPIATSDDVERIYEMGIELLKERFMEYPSGILSRVTLWQKGKGGVGSYEPIYPEIQRDSILRRGQIQ